MNLAPKMQAAFDAIFESRKYVRRKNVVEDADLKLPQVLYLSSDPISVKFASEVTTTTHAHVLYSNWQA